MGTVTMDGRQPWWQRFAGITLAGSLAFGLAGCDIFDDDDDDDDDVVDEMPMDDPVGTAFARVFHAVADAPDVDALADGNVVFEDVAFKAGTAFAEVDAVSTEFSVNALTADGEVTVIMPTAVDLMADTQYTIAAIGTVATIAPLVIATPVGAVTAGNVSVQVIHASPSAPAVDVYVTAPGADLAMAGEPFTSFVFGEVTDEVEVAAGDYQIRVTLADDVASVVFDSGTVTLPEGLDLQLFAVDNTLAGAAPISLAIIDSAGIVDPFEIQDVDTPASLRVVHASPDAPDVDVIVNDDFDNPAVDNLAFPVVTGFLDVAIPAGDASATLNVKVTPFDNPGVVVNNDGLGDDVTLDRGLEYTVLATGLLEDFELLVLVDDDRRIATDARVRIVHGSPAAGDV
ncbi:MAG: DUF4397 domain-containing protein, partial [Pseudomonadota bacterium]